MTDTADITDTSIFNLRDPQCSLVLPPLLDSLFYRGSIAHGMYVPSSDPNSIDDIDLIGVLVAPRECYLGLQEWGSRGTREIKQGHYDVVLYEARKFVRLLLQGNPNVLSVLWTRPAEQITCGPFMQSLLAHRHLFVGKHVYNAFAGYAHAQMEKMESRDPVELREYVGLTREAKLRGIHPNQKPGEQAVPSDAEERPFYGWNDGPLLQRLRSYQKKGENIGYLGDKRKRLVLEHGYDSKNAAHLIRLLRMCVEFLRTGELTVYRSDANELLSIKRGEWALERVKHLANNLFDAAREAKCGSSLPEEPDREAVEKILVEHLGKAIS